MKASSSRKRSTQSSRQAPPDVDEDARSVSGESESSQESVELTSREKWVARLKERREAKQREQEGAQRNSTHRDKRRGARGSKRPSQKRQGGSAGKSSTERRGTNSNRRSANGKRGSRGMRLTRTQSVPVDPQVSSTLSADTVASTAAAVSSSTAAVGAVAVEEVGGRATSTASAVLLRRRRRSTQTYHSSSQPRFQPHHQPLGDKDVTEFQHPFDRHGPGVYRAQASRPSSFRDTLNHSNSSLHPSDEVQGEELSISPRKRKFVSMSSAIEDGGSGGGRGVFFSRQRSDQRNRSHQQNTSGLGMTSEEPLLCITSGFDTADMDVVGPGMNIDDLSSLGGVEGERRGGEMDRELNLSVGLKDEDSNGGDIGALVAPLMLSSNDASSRHQRHTHENHRTRSTSEQRKKSNTILPSTSQPALPSSRHHKQSRHRQQRQRDGSNMWDSVAQRFLDAPLSTVREDARMTLDNHDRSERGRGIRGGRGRQRAGERGRSKANMMNIHKQQRGKQDVSSENEDIDFDAAAAKVHNNNKREERGHGTSVLYASTDSFMDQDRTDDHSTHALHRDRSSSSSVSSLFTHSMLGPFSSVMSRMGSSGGGAGGERGSNDAIEIGGLGCLSIGIAGIGEDEGVGMSVGIDNESLLGHSPSNSTSSNHSSSTSEGREISLKERKAHSSSALQPERILKANAGSTKGNNKDVQTSMAVHHSFLGDNSRGKERRESSRRGTNASNIVSKLEVTIGGLLTEKEDEEEPGRDIMTGGVNVNLMNSSSNTSGFRSADILFRSAELESLNGRGSRAGVGGGGKHSTVFSEDLFGRSVEDFTLHSPPTLIRDNTFCPIDPAP